jgi:hypothetical protein
MLVAQTKRVLYVKAAVGRGVGFKGSTGMFAHFLSAREAYPDPHKHISLIAKRYVCQFLRERDQFLGGVGILAEELLADFASTHDSV